MTDIVDRLRKSCSSLAGGSCIFEDEDAVVQAAAEITRLRARVAELEAAQQWQPIETAPKDGTKVLVARFKTGCKHDGHMAVDRFTGPGDNAGFVGFGRFNIKNWPATHWMPLPPPPKGATHDPR